VWTQLTVRDAGSPAAPQAPGCQRAVAWAPEQVQSVIFASGSPFPIFPAHWVDVPREDDPRRTERVALVDGGYSNNEPVDAAVGIGSSQVLIVRSSSLEGGGPAPVPAAPAGGRLLQRLRGPLVGDLSRLGGFLFERAQQQDRLSRREVFTLSFSPRPRRDWPALFYFRTEVVDRLRASARADLDRRIGAVESWGPPRFQLSVEVPPRRP
jgi:predicted acylesterase/phospholipase RssA